MGAYGNLDPAIAGLLFGLGHDVETGIAGEAIAFGSPVFGHAGVENIVWGAHQDQAEMSLDADLVESNIITTTVNGVAVATTFATSHAATMTAHIAALNAKAELVALGISFAAGSSTRKIVAKSKGLDITMASVVTAGSPQAGATTAYSTWAKFLGVAMFSQKSSAEAGAGSNAYAAKEAVNILTKGKIYVSCADDMTDKSAAYVVYLSGSTQGIFNGTSASNYDTGCYFRSNESGNLAILEVNGIK
jgi:hypothetical protein